MSKKDYTKYSNQRVKAEEPVIEPVEEVLESVSEPAEEPVVTIEKHGVVAGCAKLNVRQNPNTDSEVMCVVGCGTDLVIDEKASTADFYKVCTAVGVEGYCMKKFVTLLP